MASTRLPYPFLGAWIDGRDSTGITGPQASVLPGTIATWDGEATNLTDDEPFADSDEAFRVLVGGETSESEDDGSDPIDYDWYLSAVGTPRVQGPRLERFKVAVEFFVGSGLQPGDVVDQLRGIDFSSIKMPVKIDWLEKGDIVMQYQQGELGSWFTKAAVTPDRLGISRGGDGEKWNDSKKKMEAVGAREQKHFIVSADCQALVSRSAAAKDYWTKGVKGKSVGLKYDAKQGRAIARDNHGAPVKAEMTRGGGTQYFVRKVDLRLLKPRR